MFQADRNELAWSGAAKSGFTTRTQGKEQEEASVQNRAHVVFSCRWSSCFSLVSGGKCNWRNMTGIGVLFVMSQGGGPSMAAELEETIRKLERCKLLSL